MVISLIGYRATGKSTVARLLASQLGWNWVDTDREIEHRAGRSIAEIFAAEGETGFRRLEAEVIGEVVQAEDVVIAIGGGAVLRDENCGAMRRAGPVIWLRADAKTLADRMDGDSQTVERHLDSDSTGDLEQLAKLVQKRTPKYRAAADLEVNTQQKLPSAIAGEIVVRLADHFQDD